MRVRTMYSQSFAFQSTPPGWEATRSEPKEPIPIHNFNPRLPGGRRRETLLYIGVIQEISIHASRVGGDAKHIQM